MDGPTFERAKALFFEGVDSFEAGRFADAQARFEASLALVPGRASTLANLGAARVHAGRCAAALPVLDEALALEPGDLDSRSYRGIALAALGRHAEALACHDAVLAIAPDRATSWLRRGEVLQCLDRHDEALDAYQRATMLDPTLTAAWTQRGSLLREQGHLDAARNAFEQALTHGGDAELNGYFLASLSGRDVPPAAPASYVLGFFDEYAPSFDRHLVQMLGYRAPERLVGHLARPGAARLASTLDLGCGTGLCGPLLRPISDRLEGVDLSARMLEQAAARGVYDELVQCDLVRHLGTTTRRHDLVVAADVFIYVGDLAPAFEGVARVLEENARFAFTAEAAPDDAGDFVLLPSLRYAQSEPSLRSLAARHGFAIETFERAALREEQRRPVDGFYVVLRR